VAAPRPLLRYAGVNWKALAIRTAAMAGWSP